MTLYTTSISLLEKLKEPNDAAWQRFVAFYTPLIFYWAKRTGLGSEDAADLVQEVFAKLVTSLANFRYDESKSFRAWLRVVTLNKWKEMHRSHSRTHIQSCLDDTLAAENELEQMWESEYRQQLFQQACRSAEAEFSSLEWQAFQKYAINNESPESVAKELHVSVAAVYGMKSRILARLRAAVKQLESI